MIPYVIQKGKHACKIWGAMMPAPVIRCKARPTTWVVQFDESCQYNIGMPDQKDWNKGGGMSFNLFNNHQDSAMWSWRWNEKRQIVELGAYCHVNSQRVIGKDSLYPTTQGIEKEVCFEAVIDEKVQITITPGDKQYVFTFKKWGSPVEWMSTIEHFHKKRKNRRIYPWFGGNQAAPHDMFLTMNAE